MHQPTKIMLSTLILTLCIVCTARAQGYRDDPMPWMGPLPLKIDENKVMRDYETVLSNIIEEASRSKIALEKFLCKAPSAFGPTPQMEAVHRFLDAWPDGAEDEALVTGLTQAAAAGNWMARVQVFNIMRTTTAVAIYRQVQTIQWMQREKLGPIYAIVATGREDATERESPDSLSTLDTYAAFHGSYPAQNKIGKILVKHPSTAAVGRAMLDCASNTVPEYGRIFSGEAKKASEKKREDAADGRLPPLQRAIRHADVEKISRLIKEDPSAINVIDIDGHSPLDAALIREPALPQLVRLLIANGARVSEDHSVDVHSGKTQLGVASDAPAPVNLELVDLLMKAGANPFLTTSTHAEVYETAFGHVAQEYRGGRLGDIFEYMLTSKRMVPSSDLATAYADQFASSLRILNRLLAHGVRPSGRMFVRGAYLGASEQSAWLAQVRNLLSRFPNLQQAMKTGDGAFALARSARNCKFDLARAFADMGAPLREGLVAEVADHCSDDFTGSGAESTARRRAFFAFLASRHYDLDAGSDRCVAWLPDCRLPGDGIVSELLALGADPYRFGSQGKINGVLAAVSSCKLALAKQMLARPPKQNNVAIKASLTASAEQVARLACCDENNNDNNLRANEVVLSRLLAYGATRPLTDKLHACKNG